MNPSKPFKTNGTNGANKSIITNLSAFVTSSSTEILKRLHSEPQGLTEEEAKERLERYGLNEITHDRSPSWAILLLRNFKNPFIVLLVVLAIISYFLGDLNATLIIVVMVAISVIMRFIQEFRSNYAAEKLKAMVSTTATVLRRKHKESESEKREIDIKFLVPGDIISLSAGDMIPGDLRLISSKELYVSQSALSGESLPIEKDALYETSCENLLDAQNMCYMGTDVLNGTGTAVIISTGNQTYFGSMAKSITGYRAMTSFDIGINKVSWLLIKFMFIMVPVVFFLNGFTKGDWLESLLFALSVAVGLTPEMLPMIVTANLAKGAVNMSEHKVIVKQLNAIQNFGAMDILCTDKTGTLTQDRVILELHLDVKRNECPKVLGYAYLNSFYQTGLKNLLDLAVLEHVEEVEQSYKNYKKFDEIPFDFSRRRMSVIVENGDHKHLLICKGSIEEIVQLSTQVSLNDSVIPLSDEIRKQIETLTNDLNEDGMRVLAVAYKEFPQDPKKEYYAKDEKDLILMGFLAFLDPPKSTAAHAIKNLHKHHVQVKVLTGDNELVTRKICKWVNLDVDKCLTGTDIEKMNDQELKNVVDHTTIFAKLSPMQKTRVIAALKSLGHTVGYLGDGINDAPALREADIGISVDTAVDIAKESADIIMLEKSLLFLSKGVVEGRKTFGNIIKYIKMAISSNFGNVFSILGASALLPFLPMLPIQLLFQNLLYDISQIAIPFDNVDEEFLFKPRKWDPSGIARFMIFIGPISSIFDYTTFALMWFFFGANNPDKQSLFQSGWFVEGLLSQLLIVHMIRTQKIPFIQSVASLPLLLTTAVIMAIGIYVPYSFIGSSIALQPLPWSYYPWLIATLLCYCLLTQLVKNWFVRRFGYWL